MNSIILQKNYNNNNIKMRTATYDDVCDLKQWWNDGSIMAHAGFPNGLNLDDEKVKKVLIKYLIILN